jgi:hypothetical protein
MAIVYKNFRKYGFSSLRRRRNNKGERQLNASLQQPTAAHWWRDNDR